MFLPLPSLRVGDPVQHEALSVFPLFTNKQSEVDYRLADEALADQSLLVEEVDESGSVSNLRVENKGDLRVLFLEGEELVGAKQNRILNTSLLVAANSNLVIPVSCVEGGRWRYQSRFFAHSGSHSPSKLRRTLKASVSKSAREKRSHRSDQSEIWREVDCLHAAHGVTSDSAAMSDAFDKYQERIDSFREKLAYVDGAVGAAVAIGKKVVLIDVFDKPTTCQQVWDRLLSGVVFDALETDAADQSASAEDVEKLIAEVNDLPCEQSAAVGEGNEYRAESASGDHASSLTFMDTIVHGSIVSAV